MPEVWGVDLRFNLGVKLKRKHLKALQAISDEIEQEERKKRGDPTFLSWLLLQGRPELQVKAYCREIGVRRAPA